MIIRNLILIMCTATRGTAAVVDSDGERQTKSGEWPERASCYRRAEEARGESEAVKKSAGEFFTWLLHCGGTTPRLRSKTVQQERASTEPVFELLRGPTPAGAGAEAATLPVFFIPPEYPSESLEDEDNITTPAASEKFRLQPYCTEWPDLRPLPEVNDLNRWSNNRSEMKGRKEGEAEDKETGAKKSVGYFFKWILNKVMNSGKSGRLTCKPVQGEEVLYYTEPIFHLLRWSESPPSPLSPVPWTTPVFFIPPEYPSENLSDEDRPTTSAGFTTELHAPFCTDWPIFVPRAKTDSSLPPRARSV